MELFVLGLFVGATLGVGLFALVLYRLADDVPYDSAIAEVMVDVGVYGTGIIRRDQDGRLVRVDPDRWVVVDRAYLEAPGARGTH